MSRVLTQTKNRYKKTMLTEIGIILVLSVLLAFWNGKSAVDFGLGFLCAFLPFCFFVYVVFYRKQNLSTKLTALYRGEIVKFILTIILISVAFKWLVIKEFILFFIGFFMALMLNNLIPFLLNRS
ncbi:ATP synthase subunit I [Aggregatibacter sp. oral taxon 513]|jgi:ATP synthase I chain|uniref:ATP synthase subunit I n=1 Tax=Aggregatibacter sp. oral taxon 513 TaxID=712150 RepID=UPI001BA6E5A5|nr:ATP synthase subunit I [Aggregatibacter sp. oral taxon 513]QUC05886.1 ATP synthase subunit I [Aggregatibacter sp. oral taxon 513]